MAEERVAIPLFKWQGEQIYIYLNPEYVEEADKLQQENPTEFYATNEVQQIFDLTLGGALSFIFQPDKNTEEYAICRLDQNEFSTRQVAHNVYSVSMNIIETW